MAATGDQRQRCGLRTRRVRTILSIKKCAAHRWPGFGLGDILIRDVMDGAGFGRYRAWRLTDTLDIFRCFRPATNRPTRLRQHELSDRGRWFPNRLPKLSLHRSELFLEVVGDQASIAQQFRWWTMSGPITAAILYDLVQCPHRVTMDAFGNAADRDPVNAFVELLWKRGTAFEDEVIAELTESFHLLICDPSLAPKRSGERWKPCGQVPR